MKGILFLLAIIITVAFWLFSERRYKKKHSESLEKRAKQRVRLYDDNNGSYIEVVGEHEIINSDSSEIKEISGTDLKIEYYENCTLDRYTEIKGTSKIVFDESKSEINIFGDDLKINDVKIHMIHLMTNDEI